MDKIIKRFLIATTQSRVERIDTIISETKPKFNSRNQFINIAIEGFLKIQEEKQKTKKEGDTNETKQTTTTNQTTYMGNNPNGNHENNTTTTPQKPI